MQTTKPNQNKNPTNNKNTKQNQKTTHDKPVGCEGREACFEERRRKVKQD